MGIGTFIKSLDKLQAEQLLNKLEPICKQLKKQINAQSKQSTVPPADPPPPPPPENGG